MIALIFILLMMGVVCAVDRTEFGQKMFKFYCTKAGITFSEESDETEK